LASGRYILIFGAEWLIFAAFVAVDSWPPSRAQVYNLVWPGFALLLAGAMCVAGSTLGMRKPLTARVVLTASVAIAGVDHLLKLLSARMLAIGSELQVVQGHLHFRNAENAGGSWFLERLGIGAWGKYIAIAMAIAILVATWVVYRRYSKRHARGYWPNLAVVLLIGGALSCVVDLAVRGAAVDFIGIPGVVTVDLKDVALTLGAACVLVEAWDNRGVSGRNGRHLTSRCSGQIGTTLCRRGAW